MTLPPRGRCWDAHLGVIPGAFRVTVPLPGGGGKPPPYALLTANRYLLPASKEVTNHGKLHYFLCRGI